MRLGGWILWKDPPSGKITLIHGPRRLLDMLATEATLQAYYTGIEPSADDCCPLGGWRPAEEL